MDKLWNWLMKREQGQSDQEFENSLNVEEPEYTEEYIHAFQDGFQQGTDFGKLTAYEELLNLYEEKHQDQLYKIDPQMEQSR